MAKQRGPVGSSVSAHIEEMRSEDTRFRDAQRRLAPFEQIARIVIMRRAALGLSQRALGDRMGTTGSAISRLESGQHRTSTETLRRLGEALEGRVVLGFEFGTEAEPTRELVAL